MDSFDARPRKWGNSIGIVIPGEIAGRLVLNEPVHIMLSQKSMKGARASFGTLKFKKTADQLMRDIDEGWHER